MDWLTVIWLAIILATVIFVFVVKRHFRRRKNKRRFEPECDIPIGNFTDSLSSGNGLNANFGGGSGGGAGSTRSFTASTAESVDAAKTGVITANSIVNGDFAGAVVSDGTSESLLPGADIAASNLEPDTITGTATNLLSTTMDTEGVVTAAVEFMSDAAGNAMEATGEVVGAVAEVAGEIVTEIISSD
ncbi:MAG: hypothetical protein LLG02_15235 [Pelosinus sp.]|nr:hypothetical protein [Pelosinus sp.]